MSILTAATLVLYSGYLTKLSCSGKLLAASAGNTRIVQIEALPKDLGCGVLIKPLAPEGRTNLFIEASTGTYQLILEIDGSKKPSFKNLQAELPIGLKGGN